MFIHSSIKGHLGCFQLLASTNKTLDGHTLSFLLVKYLGIECLGHVVGV